MYSILLLAQDSSGLDIFQGVLSIMLVFWAFAIVASVFWLWMLIDALVNERKTEEKLLWFLVIFLLHFVGALIYYFVRRSGRGQATA